MSKSFISLLKTLRKTNVLLSLFTYIMACKYIKIHTTWRQSVFWTEKEIRTMQIILAQNDHLRIYL